MATGTQRSASKRKAALPSRKRDSKVTLKPVPPKILEEYLATYSYLAPKRGFQEGFYKGRRKANLKEVAKRLKISESTLRGRLNSKKPMFTKEQRRTIQRRRSYASRIYGFQFVAAVTFVNIKTGKKRKSWVTTEMFTNLADRDEWEEQLLNEVFGRYDKDYVIKTGQVELRRRRFD